MTLIRFALVLFFSLAGMTFAQDTGEVPERYAGLEKDKSGFRETWVQPGADLTRFDKLYVWNAEFQFRDVGPAQRSRLTMLSTRKTDFGISDADREEFQKIVSEAFFKEIRKGKNFAVLDDLDDIDEKTLIMRGAVLDIVSHVPPETIGRSEIYLRSIGEATLVMELIDPATGEVLALVAERRSLQRGSTSTMSMIPTNNVTIVADLRGWASRAASTLRRELDKAVVGK